VVTEADEAGDEPNWVLSRGSPTRSPRESPPKADKGRAAARLPHSVSEPVLDHPNDEVAERQRRARRSRESRESREPEVAELVQRLRAYDLTLRRLGLRDSQVPSLERAPVFRTLFTLGHMLFMLILASLPTLVLNAPVGLAAIVYSKGQQRAALARSKVKVRANDVLLSEKMKFAIVAVPLLWIFYAVLLLLYTQFHLQDVLTLLMVAPVTSYIGVISAESGMIALRDLRPMIMRLLYDRESVEALKREQLDLRQRVRDEIKRMLEEDEVLRELYYMRGELGAKDWERLGR
jgi:hypothetical protein